MEVSVIMLTYNRAKFLVRAIESVLSQTMQDFEFIIVDNGSTDETLETIRRYVKLDSRIRYMTLKKSSIAVGRTEGLKLAKGHYIAFVDDDDWFEADYLEILYDCMIADRADIAYCGSLKDEGGEILSNCVPQKREVLTAEQGVVKLLQRKECNAALPSKLIKRSLYNSVEFPPNSVHEDIFVTYKLFAKARRISVTDAAKYCFVRHGKNISAFTTNDRLLQPEQLEEYFSAFKERTIYLSRAIPSLAAYAQYSEWSYLISMCNKIESNRLVECEKQLSYIREVLNENKETFMNSPYIMGFEREWMKKFIL